MTKRAVNDCDGWTCNCYACRAYRVRVRHELEFIDDLPPAFKGAYLGNRFPQPKRQVKVTYSRLFPPLPTVAKSQN
jgi:hypothetical protein